MSWCNYHYYALLCTGQLLVHPVALLSFFISSVFMLFCLISLHYVNGINKVMMNLIRLLCAWYCNAALMWRIPPPNSSTSFEVSAIFGMVILITFVCALKTISLLSWTFISISTAIVSLRDHWNLRDESNRTAKSGWSSVPRGSRPRCRAAAGKCKCQFI